MRYYPMLFFFRTSFRFRKLVALLLAAICFQIPIRCVAQENISIAGTNVPFEKIIEAIKRQSTYVFFYNKSVVKDLVVEKIDASNMPVQEVLAQSLKNSSLDFDIKGKTIFIVKKAKNVNRDNNVPAEGYDVKGKVIRENGTGLGGASVLIRSLDIGSITDQFGIFGILHVPKGKYRAEVTFVGYEKAEIMLNVPSENPNIVTLRPSSSSLDEMIIKGYYASTRRLNTGNVSKVTAAEIAEQPVSNPLAALEGRVPGLVVTQDNGLPGASVSVQIRGQNSIANGNAPLYIIDGVPFPSSSISYNAVPTPLQTGSSPMANINPADIESIEVLKDADATAIYGSRGANGVILITTKKGKAGDTRFEVNVYSGMSKVARFMNLLDTKRYLQMRHEAFANDSMAPGPTDYDINGTWDSTRNTDWQKTLIGGTAHVTDAQGAFSGGNENTQFLVGGGYHRETTVFPGSFSDQKASAHFNINHSSTNQKLRLQLSGSYLNDNNHLPVQDFADLVIQLAPDAPSLYDSTGKLNWQNSTWTNPLGNLQQNVVGNTNTLVSNATITYEILPGLVLKNSMGYTNVTEKLTSLHPQSSLDPSLVAAYPAGYPAIASVANSSNVTWILEPQADYTRTFGEGKLSLLAGGSFQQNIAESFSIQGSGYASDALLGNYAAASLVYPITQAYAKYKYEAVFGRVNYNWKDKYLVNLTGRRDGSSRFGPGKQFANFGAAGLAWLFSKEKFIQQALPFLSFGKLRTSYGTAGNDQIGDYQYLSTYSPVYSLLQYNNLSGLTPTSLFNPDYAWEINKKWEGGLDLGFFKDRLLINANYYRNRSSNQLVGYPLPPTTGYPSILANLNAVVQNTGWEFQWSSLNLQGTNFSWNTSINLTVPRNKLVSYPNLSGSSYANTYVVGQPIYIVKAYHYMGVDPTTGLYTFEDLNKDGRISYPQDLASAKQIAKTYYGGFQNSLKYKGWGLDILFQFVRQTQYNVFRFFGPPGSMGSNEPVSVLSRWRKQGDLSDIQQFTQITSPAAYEFGHMLNSDKTISDASFIRLKNLSFSYEFPAAWLQQAHIQRARIYIHGQNLLTITHYQGQDPENGIIGVLPPLKTLTAGIQLSL